MPDNHPQFNYPPTLLAASSTFPFVSVNIPALVFPQGQLMASAEKSNQSDSLPASTTKHLCPRPLSALLLSCSSCIISPTRTRRWQCSHSRISLSLVPRSKTYGHVIKSKQEEQKNNPPHLKAQVPESFSFSLTAKPPYRNVNTCLFSLKPTHSNEKLFPTSPSERL